MLVRIGCCVRFWLIVTANNGLLVLHLACTARQQASAYVTIFEELLV